MRFLMAGIRTKQRPLVAGPLADVIGPALRRPAKHQPCPRVVGTLRVPFVPRIHCRGSHHLVQPTKNPDSLIGFGVVIVAVGPNPARPYSLPVASVSNDSVSRERQFMS